MEWRWDGGAMDELGSLESERTDQCCCCCCCCCWRFWMRAVGGTEGWVESVLFIQRVTVPHVESAAALPLSNAHVSHRITFTVARAIAFPLQAACVPCAATSRLHPTNSNNVRVLFMSTPTPPHTRPLSTVHSAAVHTARIVRGRLPKFRVTPSLRSRSRVCGLVSCKFLDKCSVPVQVPSLNPSHNV